MKLIDVQKFVEAEYKSNEWCYNSHVSAGEGATLTTANYFGRLSALRSILKFIEPYVTQESLLSKKVILNADESGKGKTFIQYILNHVSLNRQLITQTREPEWLSAFDVRKITHAELDKIAMERPCGPIHNPAYPRCECGHRKAKHNDGACKWARPDPKTGRMTHCDCQEYWLWPRPEESKLGFGAIPIFRKIQVVAVDTEGLRNGS